MNTIVHVRGPAVLLLTVDMFDLALNMIMHIEKHLHFPYSILTANEGLCLQLFFA